MYIPCSMPTNFKFPFFLNTLVGALLTWHKWNLKGGKRCWSNIILWFASCGYFNLFPLLIRSCNRAYYAWTNETSSLELIWQIFKWGKPLKGHTIQKGYCFAMEGEWQFLNFFQYCTYTIHLWTMYKFDFYRHSKRK